jgi:hypothetical protein
MVDFNLLPNLLKITYIFQYLQIVIAFVGIVGNFLTFIVFLRKRFRSYSFGFYIKVLTITDTIVLLHSFRHWAAFIVDWNIDIILPFFCYTGEYQPYTCASISCWLLALIAFDRWISIVHPNRFKIFKSLVFQTFLICLIVVTNLLYYMIMPMSYYIQNDLTFDTVKNVTILMPSCVIAPSRAQIANWLFLINLVLVC